jgi:hypothetical protein
MIKIRVSVNNVNKNMYIFGVWVPFDNGCQERLAAFQTTLALLESYKRHEVDPNDDLMAIMGDFNCDMDRNNRFDAIFKSFVFNNNFFNSLNYFYQEISYSYKNGDYKSSIDHILCNHALFQRVTNGQIMDENCNNSDHNPVHLSVELNLPINETLINSARCSACSLVGCASDFDLTRSGVQGSNLDGGRKFSITWCCIQSLHY